MIKIQSTFLRNWLALLSSDLISQALSFLSVFRVARHLAPEGYGLYSLVLATAALFGLLAAAGLPQVIVTEVAKRRQVTRPIFAPVLRIRTVTVLAASGMVTGYYALVQHRWDTLLVVLTLILIANASLLDVAESMAFGRQMMRFSSVLNLANSVVWVAGLYLIPLRYLTVTNLLLYYTALQVLQTAIYYLLLARSRFFAPGPPDYRIGTGRLLNLAWPYLWMGAAGLVATQAPVLLLAAFTDDRQVGFYNAGYRLVLPAMILISALARAMLPHLVAARRRSTAEFQRNVNDMLSLVIFAGGLVALALTAGAHELVLFVLGEDFQPAVPTFVNQVWTMYLYSVLIVVGIALAALERQRLLASLATLGSLVTVAFVYAGAQRDAHALSAGLLAGYAISITFHLWVILGTVRPAGRAAVYTRNMAAILVLVGASRLLPVDGDRWLRATVLLAAGVAACYWFRADIARLRSALAPAGRAAPGEA